MTPAAATKPGIAKASTAADIHVSEAKQVGQQLTDATQVDEQEWNAKNGVKHAHKSAPLGGRGHMPIA